MQQRSLELEQGRCSYVVTIATGCLEIEIIDAVIVSIYLGIHLKKALSTPS